MQTFPRKGVDSPGREVLVAVGETKYMKTPAMFLLAALWACGVMAAGSEPANVVTAKRVFLEKMGEGRFDKLDEIYGEGFVAHGTSGDFTLEEDNASGKEWRKACPNLQVTVKRTAGDGDMVAV